MSLPGHVAGLDDPSGVWYLLWSGFGAWLLGLGVVGTLIGSLYHSLRKHNCHTKGCRRIGLHKVAGTDFVVCRKHHPDDAPTHAHILRRHAEHIARQGDTGEAVQ